jgi:hypothetical protein
LQLFYPYDINFLQLFQPFRGDFCNFSNLFSAVFATLRALVTIFFYFTAGPPYENICPGSVFFSLYGNCLSNSSTAFSSTKYPSGGAYSPVTPSRYPEISSLQRKNDASSPSSSP